MTTLLIVVSCFYAIGILGMLYYLRWYNVFDAKEMGLPSLENHPKNGKPINSFIDDMMVSCFWPSFVPIFIQKSFNEENDEK